MTRLKPFLLIKLLPSIFQIFLKKRAIKNLKLVHNARVAVIIVVVSQLKVK